jgi:hypothetical protein
MREHSVGKLAAQFQQAWPIGRLRQRRACPNCLPARDERWHEAIELGPKRVLVACARIELRGDRRGDAELGRAPVLGNVQVP